MPTSGEERGTEGSGETAVAASPVVVRRRAVVAALVGYTASVVAIAYLWRASQTMMVLDWALFGVMSVIAAIYLASLVDARTPLLVADDLGVRIRLGNEWRGLPWEAIGQVVVHPRTGLLKDGRLVFVPRSLARAVEGLDTRARRHVAMNQKMYGAPLAVPLGSTTRISVADDASAAAAVSAEAASGDTALEGSGSRERRVADDIAALALGRVEVIVLEPDEAGRKSRRPNHSEGDAKDDVSRKPGGSSAATVPESEQSGAVGPTTAAGRTTAGGQAAATTASGHVAGADARAGDAHADESDAAPVTQVAFPAVRGDEPWRWGLGPAARPEADQQSTVQRDQESAVPGADVATPAAPPAAARALRSSRDILGGIGTIVSRVAKGRGKDRVAGSALAADRSTNISVGEPGAAPTAQPDPQAGGVSDSLAAPGSSGTATRPGADGAQANDGDAGVDQDGPGGDVPTETAVRRPAALRETRPALRAQATLDMAPMAGNAALDTSTREDGSRTNLPEGRELRRPGSVDLVFERVEDRVRPISTLGDAVDPLVIDDYVTEPAYDPVIGPELTAARTRLGLSVDDLAERTRIRPHVIESIEVDDFAPCGGDFYARGHLRTLARILGKDVEPLLEKFEERYATAPINARRVFEAELATGMTGSMRSTVGGPSWGLLVGVVLCLLLLWGVLRLFTTEPSEVQAPVVNGSSVVVGHAGWAEGAGS